MPTITYIEFSGKARAVDVKSGLSVMKGALKNDVPGIVAECGGDCSCATCQVYVDEPWIDRIGTPSEMEKALLDCAKDVRPNSRLSCQIRVTDALDGLIVHTPQSQY